MRVVHAADLIERHGVLRSRNVFLRSGLLPIHTTFSALPFALPPPSRMPLPLCSRHRSVPRPSRSRLSPAPLPLNEILPITATSVRAAGSPSPLRQLSRQPSGRARRLAVSSCHCQKQNACLRTPPGALAGNPLYLASDLSTQFASKNQFPMWRQSDNVPFEQSRNVPLDTFEAWRDARRDIHSSARPRDDRLVTLLLEEAAINHAEAGRRRAGVEHSAGEAVALRAEKEDSAIRR